jgi:hypothetical protein
MPAHTRAVGYLSYCRARRKHTYSSRKQARRAARIAHPGNHLTAYRCPHQDDGWHIGEAHQPSTAVSMPGPLDRPVAASAALAIAGALVGAE